VVSDAESMTPKVWSLEIRSSFFGVFGGPFLAPNIGAIRVIRG
jgi:hypothetical protein